MERDPRRHRSHSLRYDLTKSLGGTFCITEVFLSAAASSAADHGRRAVRRFIKHPRPTSNALKDRDNGHSHKPSAKSSSALIELVNYVLMLYVVKVI